MKRHFFTIFFLLFLIGFSNAQCTIDYTYSPVGANFGLSPDTLPVGFVGQMYNEDLTFFLPKDTTIDGLFLEFSDFHITSISLPLGLTWECNNSSNNCHYDPNSSQFGCVNVSGTCLIEGLYDVDVTLVATHSFSSLVGPETIQFSLPFLVLADTSSSSNSGFSMVNPSGCSPITVNFSNNNTGMLSYYWDFGNGNTSTLENPGDQIYSQPGQYIVQYSATQTNSIFFLENITVNSGLCTDNFLIGDVDLFYNIYTSSGMLAQVDISNYITQPFPLYINNFNSLQLSGQSVTIELFDDDSFWPINSVENCGTLNFTPIQQAGNWSANNSELSINYTVTEIPANTINITDTILVHDFPNNPIIIYDTLSNIIYANHSSLSMQWYFYDSPIPGATDTSFSPTSSGLYSLAVVSDQGCVAVSDEVMVVICDPTYQPMLSSNGLTAWMLDSALYSNLQWFGEDGSIAGETSPFFVANENGSYYMVAIDTFGCSYYSQPIVLCSNDMQPQIFTSGQVLHLQDSILFYSYQWMQSGMFIGNNTASMNINESGYYSIFVEDNYGCSYASEEILACNTTLQPVLLVDSNLFSVDALDMTIQWFMDGDMLVGAIDSFYEASQDGYYEAQLTDVFGCTYNSDGHTFIIESQNHSGAIKVFPNPTEKNIIIQIDVENFSNVNIKVVDILGREVFNREIDSSIFPFNLNMEDFSQGIYYLDILFDGNKISKKIIKTTVAN